MLRSDSYYDEETLLTNLSPIIIICYSDIAMIIQPCSTNRGMHHDERYRHRSINTQTQGKY